MVDVIVQPHDNNNRKLMNRRSTKKKIASNIEFWCSQSNLLSIAYFIDSLTFIYNFKFVFSFHYCWRLIMSMRLWHVVPQVCTTVVDKMLVEVMSHTWLNDFYNFSKLNEISQAMENKESSDCCCTIIQECYRTTNNKKRNFSAKFLHSK